MAVEKSPIRRYKAPKKYKWVQRYYVLYTQSEAAQARLDWYNDEGEYLTQRHIRKTIYLEQLASVSQCSGNEEYKYTFEIKLRHQNNTHQFAAESMAEMQKWIAHLNDIQQQLKQAAQQAGQSVRTEEAQEEIYEAPGGAQTYPVEIVETDAATRCQLSGKYNLVVSGHHLSLQPLSAKSTLYSWPYKLIRRYGRSSNSFTLEAGRKCDSGAGVFTFHTEEGAKIFDYLQAMTQVMKAEAAKDRGPAHTPAAKSTMPPSLPDRNHTTENQDAAPNSKVSTTYGHMVPHPLPSSPESKSVMRHIKGAFNKKPENKPQKPKSKKEKEKAKDKGKDKKFQSVDSKGPEYVNINNKEENPEESPYYVYDDTEARYSSIDDERCDSGELPQYAEVFNSVGSLPDPTYAEPHLTTMSQKARHVFKQQKHSHTPDDAYDSIDLRSAPQRPPSGSKLVPQEPLPEGHVYGHIASSTATYHPAGSEALYDDLDIVTN